MQLRRFDFAALFDEDYLYFYGLLLTPERTESEVNLIWQLLDLKPGMKVLDLACGHGRLANRLAERGCSMTGLDATDWVHPSFVSLRLRIVHSDKRNDAAELEEHCPISTVRLRV